MADPLERGWLGKRWSMIKGLAFGAGLSDNVMDAYRFLMREYEEGDRVFLFGFSRGAFTIRVLAGLLHGLGLLDAGAENLMRYVWRSYRGIRTLREDATPEEKAAAAKHQQGIDVFRRSFTRPCPIAFLGPWDTVGSVGMYNWNQSFAYTFENPSVEMVRHAVALDEKRAGFRSNVFKADSTPLPGSGRPRVMNVWFPGVHCDIGGGYAWPKCSGLAMIAFEWMVREAKAAGILVDDPKVQALLAECPPNPLADMSESLKGPWKIMEHLPARRYDFEQKKTIWRYQPNKERRMIQSPFLHKSVLDRMAAGMNYRPPSLPVNHGYPTES
jgi:uncharacterized protein (DUF2235 family)